MRTTLLITAASLFAVFAGGCTFEHQDYHYARRPEACYEPPPRHVHYYSYEPAPRYYPQHWHHDSYRR
jgi:hypothetical protein